MTAAAHSLADAAMVAAQIGRSPREPWRVVATCEFGYPSAIVSPARLGDGTPFPTWAWLTCPHLVSLAGRLESGGAGAEWTDRLAGDVALRDELNRADEQMRRRRAEETGDATELPVGIAGQRSVTGIKCLHAHTALALAGVDDPVGAWVLGQGAQCADRMCAKYRVDEG